MRRTAFLLALTLVLGAAPAASAARYGEGCAPADPPVVVAIGVVECRYFDSDAMGGITAFSYYVPPACEGARCPVLYYLHGTGGSHRVFGAQGSSGNAFVKALTSGPPVDPRTQPDPWNWSDTSTWVPKPSIDMILVAPHNPTVPGGHGPAPDADTIWTDWNPRYALGGDSQRYGTPPPRISTHLVEELVPFVDAHFPTSGSREYRAITGKSQGGFGAFANGFAHPDVFSSQSMMSGGGFPFPHLLLEHVEAEPPVRFAPPAAVPHTHLPGAVPLLAPDAVMGEFVFAALTVGVGDPVADNTYWRTASPHDLAANVRAFAADGRQSTHLQYHVNDTIPRRIPDDFLDPGYACNQCFETIVFPTNLYLEQIFDMYGIERTFRIGPGLHNNDPYQQPYYRELLEGHYENLQHRDGAGSLRPWPDVFDHRTIRTDFEIWGWTFHVDRAATEFLYLTEVTCDAITLRGTGTVTFTSPCDGREHTVDLGPSQATDELAGAGSWNGYGNTVTLEL